jgi:hypothetical protein
VAVAGVAVSWGLCFSLSFVRVVSVILSFVFRQIDCLACASDTN